MPVATRVVEVANVGFGFVEFVTVRLANGGEFHRERQCQIGLGF